jgi:hypothetical protein
LASWREKNTAHSLVVSADDIVAQEPPCTPVAVSGIVPKHAFPAACTTPSLVPADFLCHGW